MFTSGAVVRISNRAENTTDAEMSAAVNIWDSEIRFILNGLGESGVIRLCQNVVDDALLSK